MNKRFSLIERVKSFGYAIKGIKAVFWAEHNFRIHLLATVIVIGLGLYFNIESSEWLWLILAIALVLVSETFNTALEKLVDLAEPDHDPLAGKIKDIAAGAVLVAAVASLAIGIIVFWPYFCL